MMDAAAGFVEYSSFCEATDAGMTCAWNPSGTLLAAGYQDGSLIIWDPRAHRVGRLDAVKHSFSAMRLWTYSAGAWNTC